MRYENFSHDVRKIQNGFGDHHEYLFELINKIFGEGTKDLLVYPKEYFDLDLQKERILFVFENTSVTKITYLRESAKFESFPYEISALELETNDALNKPWVLNFSIGNESVILNSIEDQTIHGINTLKSMCWKFTNY